MLLHAIAKRIPEYASDIRKNFEDLFIYNKTTDLSVEQICSICLATCYTLKNALLLNNFKYEAEIYLEEVSITDIQSAVILMARNNVFYRTVSHSNNETIRDAVIGLEESALSRANIDKVTLMMCLLAISVINNCDMCVQFYTDKLLKRQVSEHSILLIIKMVAVLQAVSEVLEIESIRNYDLMPRGENI